MIRAMVCVVQYCNGQIVPSYSLSKWPGCGLNFGGERFGMDDAQWDDDTWTFRPVAYAGAKDTMVQEPELYPT
jgi:hypothetical protein